MTATELFAFVIVFGLAVAGMVAFWEPHREGRPVEDFDLAGGLVVLVVTVVASLALRACAGLE